MTAGTVIFKHIRITYGAITQPGDESREASASTKRSRSPRGGKPKRHAERFSSESNSRPYRRKTQAAARQVFPRDFRAGENFEKVQFENEQIRVTRFACAKACEVAAGVEEPVLIVALPRCSSNLQARLRQVERSGSRWERRKRSETPTQDTPSSYGLTSDQSPLPKRRSRMHTPTSKKRIFDPLHGEFGAEPGFIRTSRIRLLQAWLVLLEGMTWAGTGILLGLIGAFAAASVIASLLFDPTTAMHTE